MASAWGSAFGSAWGNAWGFINQAEQIVEQLTYASSVAKRKPRRETRLGGQYVQLKPKKSYTAPITSAQIEVKKERLDQELAHLDALLLMIEHQLTYEVANSHAMAALQMELDAIRVEQEAIKSERESLEMLAAYEAFIQKRNQRNIEILLLSI